MSGQNSMTKERPHYITCIRDPDLVRTWCGHKISLQFTFVDIEHALVNARNKGRLLTCPECAQVIMDELENGIVENANLCI